MAKVFGAKTTTEDVLAAFGNNASGKYFLITGGNSGLGKETALSLVKAGAHVVIGSRSLANGQKVVEEAKATNPNADIEVFTVDLDDLTSVKAFAQQYIETKRPLHGLINNAGIMGTPKGFTAQGYERQFGVNHLGHFLLTTLLLPVLESTGTATSPARVVNVSSLAQWLMATTEGIDLENLKSEKYYNPWTRYGETKLANVLFARELNRREKAAGKPVIAVALHPGVILGTGLVHTSDPWSFFSATLLLLFSPSRWGAAFTEPMKTVQQGAATQLYCSLADDVVGGEYYMDCHVETYHRSVHVENETLALNLWKVSQDAVQAFL